MVFGVPYTGIFGKNTAKTLIPHQRFSWIFDLRIYGGSDPIYGETPDFHRKWVKNRDFSHILLCAKSNRFFIILGGGQFGRIYGWVRVLNPQEIDDDAGTVGFKYM